MEQKPLCLTLSSFYASRKGRVSGEEAKKEERFLRKDSNFLFNIGRTRTGGLGGKKSSITMVPNDVYEEHTWWGKS